MGNAVRRAVNDGICERKDVFITTKIVPWSYKPDQDIEDSLKRLGVDYIDLCLLHQSGSNEDGVYRAIEKYVKEGKIRSAGISNFYNVGEVDHFLKDFEIVPAVIQNENHIYAQGTVLRDYCKKYGIFIESYYPFGGRGHTKDSFNNKTVYKFAQLKNKSSAQVILRWHLQAGFIAIPGSSNPEHIAENFNVWDFTLSDDEMNQIYAENRNARYENW